MPSIPLLVTAAAAVIKFAAADAVVADCVSKPDHSDYSGDVGLNKDGAWCQYDKDNFYRPAGIGCKSDSECNRSMFPHPNGKDSASIQVTAILNSGEVYCDYVNGVSGSTQCYIGITLPPTRPGAKKAGASPDPDPMKVCREYLSDLGHPDVNIVAACRPDPNDAPQCCFTCNSSGKTCPAGSDPNTVHKALKRQPGCPGPCENAKADV